MPRGNTEFKRSNFSTNSFDWDSDVEWLKYIKTYFGDELRKKNIYKLGDVVNAVLVAVEAAPQNPPEETIRDLVGSWTINKHAHECRSNDYLPRPVNRFAFNALIDLVDFARDDDYSDNGRNAADLPDDLAGNLICDWNEGLTTNPNWDFAQPDQEPFCHRATGRGSAGPHRGAVGMRRCPCLGQEQCVKDNNCQWLGSHSACVGRDSRRNRGHPAPDIQNYAGDRKGGPAPTAMQRRPNSRYVPTPDGYTFAIPLPLINDTDSESDSEGGGSPPGPGSPPVPSPDPGSPAPPRLPFGIDPANVIVGGRRQGTKRRKSARLANKKKKKK